MKRRSDQTSIEIMTLAIGAICFFVGGIYLATKVNIIVGLLMLISSSLPAAKIYSIGNRPHAKRIMAIATVLTLTSWCGFVALLAIFG